MSIEVEARKTWLLVGITALVFVVATGLVPRQSKADVRALTASELESTFGNACAYCYETWRCTKNQVSGEANCQYCNYQTSFWYPCCSSPDDSDSCSEETTACKNADRYVAEQSGGEGYCGTCDMATTPTKDGTCGGRGSSFKNPGETSCG